MLTTTHILPTPQLDPHRYVSVYLSNPLLLAAHADEMEATAAHWANGDYDANATVALAAHLFALRKYQVLRAPTELRDNEAEQEVLALANHPLFKAERADLRIRIFDSRPSEYDWLRGLLETALIDLAAQRDAEHLEAFTPFAHRAHQRQLLLDVATTATRLTGIPVRLASELVA